MIVLHGRGVSLGNEGAEALKEPPELLPVGEKLMIPICPVEERANWQLPEPDAAIGNCSPIATEIAGTKKIYVPVGGTFFGEIEKDLPGKGHFLCAVLTPTQKPEIGGKHKLNRPSKRALSTADVLWVAEEFSIIDEIDGLPLAEKLKKWLEKKIQIMVCDSVCDDPYNTDDRAALRENASEVIRGLELAARVCGCEETMIVIDRKYSAGFSEARRLDQALSGQKVLNVYGKYPIWPKLAKTKHFSKPFGRIGVQACIRLQQAFYLRRPPERCIITVAGDGVVRNRNFSVMLGTPLTEVLRYCKRSVDKIWSLSVGSALTGELIRDPDVPVMQDTRCILALTKKNDVPRTEICIGCGKCNEVCCQRIFASEVVRMINKHERERAFEYGADRCIKCSACSAICPVGVPVMEMISALAEEVERTAKNAGE